MKHANKDDKSAERVEGRGPAKGHTRRKAAPRTQSRNRVSSGLARVRQAARRDKKMRFTALMHHVTPELLEHSYYALKREAAPGLDGVTWAEYGQRLQQRLAELHERVHRGTYRAQPSKRAYIEKSDGRRRPLGISALEDKIVQQAVATVLAAVYEEEFLGFSYGFRPGRGQHDALDALWTALMDRGVNWVLDADVSGFFDAIDHDWLLRMIEHRIQDRRILRLIRKWLRAGVCEAGQWRPGTVGTPQGAVISPLLANIYLHYVLDLWAHRWRGGARGAVIIVRYADDFVLGFQDRAEAQRFRQDLEQRLNRFGLQLHPHKTRLIAFGRPAAGGRRERGPKGPGSFAFLGFLHFWGKDRKGRIMVQRKTVGKRLRRKLRELRDEMMRRRHAPLPEQGQWVRAVVSGYFRYHAVPGNSSALNSFRTGICRHWKWALTRRSQKGKMSWERFNRYVRRWLPSVRILHPLPCARFGV